MKKHCFMPVGKLVVDYATSCGYLSGCDPNLETDGQAAALLGWISAGQRSFATWFKTGLP